MTENILTKEQQFFMQLMNGQGIKNIEAIQRVRELHKPDEDWPDLCAAPDCNFGLYPCGTIKALDGEQ